MGAEMEMKVKRKARRKVSIGLVVQSSVLNTDRQSHQVTA